MDPIFIVGSPRSGTSLLRVMLNRHPLIGLCDETYYFYYVYSRRRSFGRLNNSKARQYLLNKYLATDQVKKLGINLDVLSEILMREGDSYKSFFDSLIRFWAAEHGKIRYGEKTPHHSLFSETLCEWYPNCKLIHIVRDPRDVVASLMRMPWSKTPILANVRSWLRHTMGAERCSHRDNYLLVRYEQFVSEPEKELKRICSFIGEKYHSSMLEADTKVVAVKWWFQRAQGPLTKSRSGKWREELNREQVAIVEWLVEKYMRQFGYKPTGWKTSATRVGVALIDEFYGAIRSRIITLPRLWYYWIQPTNLAAEERWIDDKM